MSVQSRRGLWIVCQRGRERKKEKRVSQYVCACMCASEVHPQGWFDDLRMYLWWSLCTLYLCQVRVTVDVSGLCCCTCVTYFERWITSLWVDSPHRTCFFYWYKCLLSVSSPGAGLMNTVINYASGKPIDYLCSYGKKEKEFKMLYSFHTSTPDDLGGGGGGGRF